MVHERIADSDHGCRCFEREVGAIGKVGLIGAIVARGRAKEDVAGIAALHLCDIMGGFAQRTTRQGNQDHAGATLKQIR